MLRNVFQRRLGKSSLIALTLLLVVIAGTASAVHPLSVFASSTDTCGYNPSAAPAPGGGTVVFDENTVTRAIGFFGVGLNGHVGVFANDETGLNIGSGGTPSSAVPGQVYGQAVPPTFGSGGDGQNRPIAPTIYLTDITSDPSATGGDWENGGQPATTGASGLYGSWTPGTGKPVNKNNWVLGPNADPIPATDAFGGQTTSFNQGYGAEVTWNVAGLKAYDPTTKTFVGLQPGHTYRAQSMTHDGDQNHTSGGGDVGEVCTTFSIPAPNLSITKTADAASVDAGSPIGFTVEIKNTGNVAATNAVLNDPLPAGNGTGVTWAIDSSTGTPANFAITGAKGSQTLGLASSSIPVGADWIVHVTAATSASECSTYNNTATVSAFGVNPTSASASEACKPPNVTVTKTADAASVSAGGQVGFTVEVKNAGPGTAFGASLNDPLPAGNGTGVTWAIDPSTGTPGNFVLAGAKGSQTLSLASSTLAPGADYTVHITAMTSASECSTYDNTATVTITNGSNPSPAEAVEQCKKPGIQIVKTADAPQVSAGSPIGFTVTVYNTGSGDATGTTLTDPLPQNAGLSWTIDNTGSGWNACSIVGTTLSCGGANGVTVPANTSLANSTYTVHVSSPTTAATGGDCPNTGVVTNTGTVNTTNSGSQQSTATTCVAKPNIQIVKTSDAPQVNAGSPIGFTVTVYNTGKGDATGTTLTDPLPQNAGLSWTIDNTGSGWNHSCSIVGTTLTCGGANGVTVPAGTTQNASTYTVHISSPTTSATGGTCPNTGVVSNTGTVTTTNGGSGQSTATTCVAKPNIQILKTADAAQVNVGDPIGFTVTVYNTGSGDATGTTLTDPLPQNAGLSWKIDNVGSGWNSCSIVGTTLSCGGANGVTVPANTSQNASTYTVHISSATTAATGGSCPSTGVVNNTGTVTTTNSGSAQSTATTCVAKAGIQIVKTADAPQVNAGDPIGFTVTVFNTGTGDAKGATLTDPLPQNSGLSWKIDNTGSGWSNSCVINGTTLSCGGVNGVTVPANTMQVGSTFTVHISSTTTQATGGVCPNGNGVVTNTGTVNTTNAGSQQSTASTCVAGAAIHVVKTADAPQVNAGDPIGFTVTVYNNGSGDAKNVTLSDPLPTTQGLAWQIDNTGSGWNHSCSISGTTLSCGGANGVTVPGGTSQNASTYTVHITSATSAATAGTCPSGSGVVTNTGYVTTSNAGSDQSTASTCVAAASIHVVKTADAAQVDAGDPIGFTVTVYNTGSGNAKNVTLSDPLPQNSGLSWAIDGEGSGWGGSCQINGTTLNCGGLGGVTVPANTTKGASTYTVHISSTTNQSTGGVCPSGSGVVSNTGYVSSSNAGSDQSTAVTCVAGPSIQVLKTADSPQVNAGSPIGFTVTLYNTGSGAAKGVNLNDPLPTAAGLNWQIDKTGSGWNNTCAINGTTLTCGGPSGVTVPAGTNFNTSSFTVHITSQTTAQTGGTCPNGSGVVSNTGYVTSSNAGSTQSTASTCVAKPNIQILKTADAAQVNAGDPVGFTVTVYNNGTGDATGTTLTDPLPQNTGLSWVIDKTGSGWNNSCVINGTTLTCGGLNGVTVPANTSQGLSTFTVHISSTTTPATGGNCPNTGVVTNTGYVSTSNGGSGQSTASTCVAGAAIHVVKTADSAQVNAGEPIGFTVTVYNSGTGDAKNVTLNDPLPTNTGLLWTIDNTGSGWNHSCSISGSTLSCGGVNGVTVPANTMQVGSTFTVHITSQTTAQTGGTCPNGNGVVTNTGYVTSSNGGSDQSTASTCVAGASVQIVKTADATQVAAGTAVGFTMTVYNNGTGAAKGVTLNDPLPQNTGLSWTIDNTGSGWNNSCVINGTTLTCGGTNGVTVPAGTTQGASTFTVHITSPTTSGTGGLCPDTGNVDNTGYVSSSNAGSGQSEAKTCVEGITDLAITKTVTPTTETVTAKPYGNLTWTMIVKNNGPLADTNVQVGDPMPAGNVYVDSNTTKGSCTGGAILKCSLGTMQPGDTVQITLITTPTVTGPQVNTATVVGDLAESDYTNNQATAKAFVKGEFRPPFCDAVIVTPRQLFVGRKATLHFKVVQGRRVVKGIRVQVKGPGFHFTTRPSNAKGKASETITPRKKGIMYFKPIVTSPAYACTAKIGVSPVVVPPVTG